MPVIQESELKKQITQADFAPLYVLYGEEKYLLTQASSLLIRKASPQDFTEFNVNEFGANASIDKIADAVQALPLMSPRKCVVVSDFNPEEKNAVEISKLKELLENLSETTVLIFYYPTADFSGKTTAKLKNFLKQATQKGTVIEFKFREAGDLSKRLIKQAEKLGCVLSKQNAERLMDYTGTDMKSLFNEVEKLAAFAAGEEIEKEMIERLVPKNMDATAFMLADALAGGSYEKAYQLMHQLIDGGEELVAVLAALSAAYVDMMRVKAAAESGLSCTAPAEYGSYKGKEFRLRKAERAVKRLPLAVLRESLAILLETDVALKSSRTDTGVLMDKLIAQLLLCVGGEKAS